MNTHLRHHVTHLDRTIVALLNERARLFEQVDSAEAPLRGAHVEDLLQRSTGPFPAEALRDAFEAIDRGCSGGPL